VGDLKRRVAKWAGVLLLAALGLGILAAAAIHLARSRPRLWRQLGAFFEAFGGMLGVAFIGICVLALLFVLDPFMGEEERPREGKDSSDR
jgi:hypothetical protein